MIKHAVGLIVVVSSLFATVVLDAVELKLCFTNYRLEKRLGVGSFGTVYLARDTALNTLVAIKHTKFLKGETDRELESLTALVSQPNVLQLECTQMDQEYVYFVTEYCPDGDLRALLTKHPVLPESTVWSYLSQMAEALKALRVKHIIHRDLKPENILLTQDSSTIKIADFGLSITTEEPIVDAKGVAGSLSYLAPERLARESYDTSSDLWAIGLIVYEMSTGARLFQLLKHDVVKFRELVDSYFQRNPKLKIHAQFQLSLELSELLSDLLVPDPSQRMPFNEFYCRAKRTPMISSHENATRGYLC